MRKSIQAPEKGPEDCVVAFCNKMMKRYGDADRYEESLKNRFRDGEIDILIVCSREERV